MTSHRNAETENTGWIITIIEDDDIHILYYDINLILSSVYKNGIPSHLKNTVAITQRINKR